MGRKLFKLSVGTGLEFFQSKRAAKKVCDKLNEDRKRAGSPLFVVMRGPDHWLGESFNVSHQMMKQRQNA